MVAKKGNIPTSNHNLKPMRMIMIMMTEFVMMMIMVILIIMMTMMMMMIKWMKMTIQIHIRSVIQKQTKTILDNNAVLDGCRTVSYKWDKDGIGWYPGGVKLYIEDAKAR